MLGRLRQSLFQPVDAASLVFFRICFGLIMVVEAYRYFTKGWIPRYYIEPDFHFKYYGFEWVEPWPGDGMYWHFAVLGILGFTILVGAFYRISAILFFFVFSYVFLLDQAQYLNHFYLVILISFLMCFLPAHRSFSVDAWLFPKLRSRTIPAWAVWILVAQFEIMYLYAGFVKINPDWLALEPLGTWLNYNDDLPIIGPYFAKEWVVAVGAYGVILLHLIGAPLLLWRRTRLAVFIIYASFHMMNHVVFWIGIFPWFTLAATMMFFDPDWPRQVARRLLGLFARVGDVPLPSTEPRPGGSPGSVGAMAVQKPPSLLTQYAVMAFMAIWIVFQVALPLRHYLLPGDVAWNEDGHRFSWRMKLRDKKGDAEFIVRDPRNGEEWFVDPDEYLTRRQARKMRTRPDMILQFAHYLEKVYREEEGVPAPEVRADIQVSLNFRPEAQFVDPGKDLTKIRRSDLNATWILPLTVPLPEERDWVGQ